MVHNRQLPPSFSICKRLTTIIHYLRFLSKTCLSGALCPYPVLQYNQQAKLAMSDPLLSRIRHVLDAFENEGVTLSREATQRIMLESDEILIQLREDRAGSVISVSKMIDMEATAKLFDLALGRWDNPMELLESGLSDSAGKSFLLTF